MRLILRIEQTAWEEKDKEAEFKTCGAISAVDVVKDAIEAKFGLNTVKIYQVFSDEH